MASLIVFDDGKGQLGPLTDLRPAFDLRTGAFTTLERTETFWGERISGLVVPPHLAAITRERHGLPVNGDIEPDEEGALILNGRCPLWRSREAPMTGFGRFEESSGDLVIAALERDDARRFVRGEHVEVRRRPESLRSCLISRPWHIRTWRDEVIRDDLREIEGHKPGPGEIPPGVGLIGSDGVRIQPSARVYPTAVLDTESGPILIGDHAVVRPGAVITGPAYIGPHSTVLDRAVIRANTSIGPWCKVAGEVSGTIFQGYANKAHDGFLGDSYVGEWANLGAGTTNSNLLNTYGEVLARATPGSSIERTGETFLGCIIGDHAKFAICTRIMTGSVVHTGAMWAATAPVSGCVAPFAWVTDAGAKRYRFDKFAEVARTVMGRRGVTPSEAYMERLRALRARNE